jgi:hypothetical protein
MGFFNKLRKKVRGQVAPVMPTGSPLRRTLQNQSFSTPQPMPKIGDMRFRGRMPQKRGGLADIIRRLQEQLRNQQMRAPQPIPERMPVSNVPSFNPTIFGQPIRRDMDFSQMPQISPEDMRNLQVPTQMPVMPEERMAPPIMNQMQGEPRMMMAGGRDASMVDFLNSDPRQQMFGVETRIEMLENQLQEALANNDMQAYDMIVQQINDADAQRINIMNSMNPTPTIPDPIVDRMIEAGRGRTVSDMDRASLDDILADLEKKN